MSCQMEPFVGYMKWLFSLNIVHNCVRHYSFSFCRVACVYMSVYGNPQLNSLKLHRRTTPTTTFSLFFVETFESLLGLLFADFLWIYTRYYYIESLVSTFCHVIFLLILFALSKVVSTSKESLIHSLPSFIVLDPAYLDLALALLM